MLRSRILTNMPIISLRFPLSYYRTIVLSYVYEKSGVLSQYTAFCINNLKQYMKTYMNNATRLDSRTNAASGP